MMFGVPSKGAKLDLDMSKIYSKEITLLLVMLHLIKILKKHLL